MMYLPGTSFMCGAAYLYPGGVCLKPAASDRCAEQNPGQQPGLDVCREPKVGSQKNLRKGRPVSTQHPSGSDAELVDVIRTPEHMTNRLRTVARIALASGLAGAGISHLSWARTSFRAQVPGWVPGDADTIVLLSGVVEIALGASLAVVRSKRMGWLVGAFFVAVFPGNISQLVNHKDAFGLDSDTRRALRLLFQPVLVVWALWSTAEAPTATEIRTPGP
jgi:uncharacterized membrane protein